MLVALLLAYGSFIEPPHAPRLPIFGPGPVFNLNLPEPDRTVARENALLHVYSSAMVVGLGERLGGRRGMRWMVAGWLSLNLVREACFHGGGPPEVRTDLASVFGSALLTWGVYEIYYSLAEVH